MVIIPLTDKNELRYIKFQYITLIVIVSCVVVFGYQVSLGYEVKRYFYEFGTIPALVTGKRQLAPELGAIIPELTLLSSMFLHGGWVHLVGNMLFLWVFGDNVEDALGHLRFILFYLACGVVAVLAHIVAGSGSVVPYLGASGAISGVMGAYLLLYPRAKVLTVIFRFIIRLPAYIVLGLWIGFQAYYGWLEQGYDFSGGVAWWAHIGGFAAGLLLVIPFKRNNVQLELAAGDIELNRTVVVSDTDESA